MAALPGTSVGRRGGTGCVDQALERLACAIECSGSFEEPEVGVESEHDAVLLERELLGIEIGAEVTFADRDARGFVKLVDPILA